MYPKSSNIRVKQEPDHHDYAQPQSLEPQTGGYIPAPQTSYRATGVHTSSLVSHQDPNIYDRRYSHPQRDTTTKMLGVTSSSPINTKIVSSYGVVQRGSYDKSPTSTCPHNPDSRILPVNSRIVDNYGDLSLPAGHSQITSSRSVHRGYEASSDGQSPSTMCPSTMEGQVQVTYPQPAASRLLFSKPTQPAYSSIVRSQHTSHQVKEGEKNQPVRNQQIHDTKVWNTEVYDPI